MLDQNRIVMNQVATVTEMQAIVRFAAEPARSGELIKAQINRAARLLGLTSRRAETFWYGRPGRILAEEADHLRAWRDKAMRGRRDRLLAEIAALDRREEQLRLAIGDETEQLRLTLKVGEHRVDL